MSEPKPSPLVTQTLHALTVRPERRQEGTRRTSDLCWPEARILGEALREVAS